MTELLFESFWTLLVLDVIFSLSAAAWYIVRRTPAAWNATRIVPAIFAVLLAINVMVETDREAIRKELGKLISACKSGNANAIVDLMAPDFTSGDYQRQTILKALNNLFNSIRVESVTLTSVQNTPPVITIATFSNIRSRSGNDYSMVKSDWTLEYVRQDGRWLLRTIKPISINNMSIKDMHEVFNTAHTVQ